ncbi:MAG TPA: AAA family ATPase [Polyangiaceae bacterium]|nr:AAA family ATPase [Polyangiaceae bacterium]
MQLHDALLSPEAFPAAPLSHVERIATHISWVFLLERDVYKVKRPVDLGFLDFRTLEKRRLACEAEVELNRRLAAGVYLGVVPIGRTADGNFHVNGPGQVVDWAVHMRRVPDADRADNLLKEGKLSVALLDEIARRLAEFHAHAPRDPHIAHFGAPEQITQNVSENFVQTRSTVERFLSRREAGELENWQRNYLRDHATLFRERLERGYVRDGHGDLRLEHVYVEASGITILDCIEFNDRFRFADVCADIAFLSMDLEAAGRVDLAELLLARYARYANDFDLYGLVDFYESYRAFVRAKVASFTAADATVDYPTRELALQRARHYALLALSAKRSPIVPPVLVAIGGLIASGKSTLAEGLGSMLAAPVVDTDRIRKHLSGRLPLGRMSERPFEGVYSADATEKVYDELRRRARVVLRSGRPLIVEASFRTAAERGKIRALALECQVPFHFLECRASTEICQARLVERGKGPSVSDGRPEIFDAFAASFEAVTELDPSEHVVVDTTRDLELTLDGLRRRFGVERSVRPSANPS